MEGPTYKGRREVKGREGGVKGGSPRLLRFLPGSRGARIVTEGEPLQWGRKGHGGWEKFVIFDRNRRLSRKRYEIGPCLLLNAYMKSHALYRMMTFLMTFTDPYPGFQGHGIFMSNISTTKNLTLAYGQVTIEQ